MLFNSPDFLFVYLPATLILFFALGSFVSAGAAAVWLALASLAFYGWTDPGRLLPIVIASTAFNFVVGTYLARYHDRPLLWFGVAANLLYLGYFKYSNFVVATLNDVASLDLTLQSIELPLGISFFTFTQIAFLVDAYRREVSDYRPLRYTLFVTFFPHLIAGPIIHHKEIMPQFADPRIYRFNLTTFTVGLTWFGFGLAKKVLLADNVAGYARVVFTAARQAPLALTDAWLGAVAYALQIYFDFSGYSDMAIGLALMFGIVLPLNFNSPYKSDSLIEFWRRWHMTLSRFLRDYLYIQLGGSRKGAGRRYLNLFVCMLLGGLWHGPAWNFVIWGALHGVGLAVNHLWRDLVGKKILVPSIVGTAMVLVFVVAAWVPFRAETTGEALKIWCAMFGFAAPSGAGILGVSSLLWIGSMAAVALLMPNTQQIMQGDVGWLRWRPGPVWAMASGLAVGAAIAVVISGGASEFLYFRF